MTSPTAFNPTSSDQQRKAENPFIGYDLIKGQYINSSVLASNGGTGYVGTFSVNLSKLNLDLIIPDSEVYYHYDTPLGGGISSRTYVKLPFTMVDTNGNIAENAYFDISFQYDETKGEVPLSGTTFLDIRYFNRTSSSAGQSFDYKIKSSRAQTIDTSNLGM